jgi:hypothetical protein
VNTRIKRIVRPELAEKKNTRVDGASAKPLPSTLKCATKKSKQVKKAPRKADRDSDSEWDLEVDRPIRSRMAPKKAAKKAPRKVDSDSDWDLEEERSRRASKIDRKSRKKVAPNHTTVFQKVDLRSSRFCKAMDRDSGLEVQMDSTTSRRAPNKTAEISQPLPSAARRQNGVSKARKKLNLNPDTTFQTVDSHSSGIGTDRDSDNSNRKQKDAPPVTRKLFPNTGEVQFWVDVAAELGKARTFTTLQQAARNLSNQVPALPVQFSDCWTEEDTIDGAATALCMWISLTGT